MSNPGSDTSEFRGRAAVDLATLPANPAPRKKKKKNGMTTKAERKRTDGGREGKRRGWVEDKTDDAELEWRFALLKFAALANPTLLHAVCVTMMCMRQREDHTGTSTSAGILVSSECVCARVYSCSIKLTAKKHAGQTGPR